MSLQLIDPPFAVEVAVGICGGLMALSALGAMYAIVTIFARTQALVPREGYKNLPPSVRKAREFDRAWQSLMAPEVKRPRQLLLACCSLIFVCAAITLLLTVIFGTRIPT